MTVAVRPHVSIGIDVDLGYIANQTSEVGVDAVIASVQSAVMLAINQHPANAPLAAAPLATIVGAVPGIVRCRYLFLDGDVEDLPIATGGFRVDVPAEVDCGDARILQT